MQLFRIDLNSYRAAAAKDAAAAMNSFGEVQFCALCSALDNAENKVVWKFTVCVAPFKFAFDAFHVHLITSLPVYSTDSLKTFLLCVALQAGIGSPQRQQRQRGRVPVSRAAPCFRRHVRYS